ncbi:MAG TPA: DUF6249 domain-containing protein, partial [Chthoniobacterales bacterium]
MITKISLLTCLASAALAMSAFGQDPTASPTAPPLEAASPSPAAAAAPSTRPESDLERRIQEKVKRHLSVTFGDDHDRKHASRSGDTDLDEVGAVMAIPIVGIIFSAIFGAPVMIVAVIMFFSFWKARSLHKTVRLMVEKGQPVPESLFAPPHSPARQRSDMRRGVVLVMIGLGIMIFLGAVNDWEGGAWAVGIIPFLIG